MSHSHSHEKAGSRIALAFFVNLLFTIIEIIGGIYTNSFAILSDALHDLGDSFSLGISWYFQKISKRGRTKEFTYGYKRFSVLGALLNALILIIGSVFILSEAIPALWVPHQVDVNGMILLSILGIIFNGIAAWRMSKGKILNERVVFLHLIEDVLGWVAVLIGSVLLLFFDLPWIDPLLSILISIYIVYNVLKHLKRSMSIFLQGTPENISEEKIRERVLAIEGISNIHDCHVWTLDGDYNILTLHIVVNNNLDLSEQAILKQKIKKSLTDLSINHLTLEFETEEQDCEMVDC